MSNKALKYICLTIVFCCAILSTESIFKLILTKELQELNKTLEIPTIEEEPINLEDLLMPKEIFPRIPLPNMDKDSYAEQKYNLPFQI